MKRSFPKLPGYQFSWRSLQVEPIPQSGERITLATIVQGGDQALIAAKLVPSPKLKKIYGPEFGGRLADALALCLRSAEDFYSKNLLSSEWTPPLGGFYFNKVNNSVAVDIYEGLAIAASHCSSFSVSIEAEKLRNAGKPNTSAPETWRKEIVNAVIVERADFVNYFDKQISISGSGVPMKFGFVSNKYAAQFDALSDIKGIQQGLVRAQSKLWQLDRLRDDNGSLFPPEECELLLQTPQLSDSADDVITLKEFLEELQYEASRRELGIYSTMSANEAAKHLINKAA